MSILFKLNTNILNLKKPISGVLNENVPKRVNHNKIMEFTSHNFLCVIQKTYISKRKIQLYLFDNEKPTRININKDIICDTYYNQIYVIHLTKTSDTLADNINLIEQHIKQDLLICEVTYFYPLEQEHYTQFALINFDLIKTQLNNNQLDIKRFGPKYEIFNLKIKSNIEIIGDHFKNNYNKACIYYPEHKVLWDTYFKKGLKNRTTLIISSLGEIAYNTGKLKYETQISNIKIQL